MTKPKILASGSGRIQKILFLNSPATSEQSTTVALKNFHDLFATFVKHGSPDLQIYLLMQMDIDVANAVARDLLAPSPMEVAGYWEELRKFIKEQAPAIQRRVHFIEPDLDLGRILWELQQAGFAGEGGVMDWHTFYDFIQDPFLVMQGAGKSIVLLEPYYSWMKTNNGDCNGKLPTKDLLMAKFIPEILSSKAEMQTKSTHWQFEGGNVQACKHAVFVGVDVIHRNLKTHAADFTEDVAPVKTFLQAFAKTLGVAKVICPSLLPTVTKLEQLKCQPIGLYHLDMWLTCAGETADGRSLVFVGELYVFDATIQAWRRKELGEFTSDQSYLQNAVFNLIQNPKLKVARLPILVWGNTYLSYCNCLVEPSADHKMQVFMPVFAKYLPSRVGDSAIFEMGDDLAEAAFRAEGITVRGVDFGYRDLAFTRNAGLHCKSLVLARK